MRDFLPNDRDCMRSIHDYLLEAGYAGNVEVINVPQSVTSSTSWFGKTHVRQQANLVLPAHDLTLRESK